MDHISRRYASEGRTAISVRICRALKWKQANGIFKETACREVMRKLENRRLISLPKPWTRGAVWTSGSSVRFDGDKSPIRDLDFQSIRLEKVSDKKDPRSQLWNSLVGEFHYLKQPRLVGRQIKYIFWVQNRPVACFGWTDAAWAIRARDNWIGWSPGQLTKRRHLIINNARFLILPWVKVPNLASFLIATCTGAVVRAWAEKYGFCPVLAETFVDPARFTGVCYRAANWTELGNTLGYAKVGGRHHNSQQPKILFVHPLDASFRRILKGKPPHGSRPS